MASLILFLTMAVAVFALAAWVRFRINERRFMRRNVAGLQLYDSYGQALATSALEAVAYRISMLLQWVAVAVVLGSAILLMVPRR